MMKTDQFKAGNAVTALERFADGVGPIALLGLSLAAAVALVGTAGF